MTESELYDQLSIAVERYGDGYLLADYSGPDPDHTARYCGQSMEWRRVPAVHDPFPTKDAAIAKAFERGQINMEPLTDDEILAAYDVGPKTISLTRDVVADLLRRAHDQHAHANLVTACQAGERELAYWAKAKALPNVGDDFKVQEAIATMRTVLAKADPQNTPPTIGR